MRVHGAALWERLRPLAPSVRFLDALSPTDAFATATRSGHRSWRVVATQRAGSGLRVRNLPPPARALFAGNDDQSLEGLCLWHAERLRELACP